MRGLRDFKVPNFKFPKFKMKELSEIDEVKLDYEKIQKAHEEESKKELKNYTPLMKQCKRCFIKLQKNMLIRSLF